MSNDITITTVYDEHNLYHPVLRDGVELTVVPIGFKTREEAIAYGEELRAIHNFFLVSAQHNCPSPTDGTTSPTSKLPVTAR